MTYTALLVNKKSPVGSGAKIAEVLKAQVVTCNYWPSPELPARTTIINWSRSQLPEWYHHALNNKCRFINSPADVCRAVNKYKTLYTCRQHGVPCLDFTSNMNEAQEWAEVGEKVYIRHTMTGSCGEGIEVFKDIEKAIPLAPLYTKGIGVVEEYRIGVVDGVAINCLLKVEKEVNADYYVRTIKTGWNYERVPGSVHLAKVAVDAIHAVGLDFGEVDILEAVVADDRPYDYRVCEINSAPELPDETFDHYITALKEML